MDEKLSEEFLNNFSVTKKSKNDVRYDHPRFSQYKEKSKKHDDQNERRLKHLELLKKRRFDCLSLFRSLSDRHGEKENYEDSVEKDEDLFEKDEDSSDEDMDVVEPRPKRGVFSNHLMLSEWLVDIPVNLTTEWYSLICPIGARNLVVSSNHLTKVYTKNGKLISTFKSSLPGGGYSNGKLVILDCIFSSIDQTYYVLDTMCWNDHQFYDGETEFRFYFRDIKLKEVPQVSVKSSSNPYPFKPLEYSLCTKKNIQAMLDKWDSKQVDGILFYYKKSPYSFGSTPLVTWLKPHMLDKVLGDVL